MNLSVLCCRVVALWRSLLFCCWLLSVVCAAWLSGGVLCLVVFACLFFVSVKSLIFVYFVLVNWTHFTFLCFAFSHLSVCVCVCVCACPLSVCFVVWESPSVPSHPFPGVGAYRDTVWVKAQWFFFSLKKQLTRARLTLSQPRMILSAHIPSLKQLLCVHRKKLSWTADKDNCAQWIE